MLEGIASAESSEDTENNRLGASGKEVRTAAYVRLGAIGTPESLGAARRVEAKLRATPLLPGTVTLDVWPHPMWHFSDSEVKPFATTKTADSTTYGIVSEDLLGDASDLFLISTKTPKDRTSGYPETQLG